MAKWTPEPWVVSDALGGVRDIYSGDRLVARALYHIGSEDRALVEANAHRIVATVNACAGISTEALEGGVVKQLVWALKGIADEGCILPTTMKSLAEAALDKLKEVPK